jgi:hypothetical protein
MSDITDAGPRLRAMNDALENASLRLTDAERQAIARAVDIFDVHPRLADEGKAATLRGLLDRTKDGGKCN